MFDVNISKESYKESKILLKEVLLLKWLLGKIGMSICYDLRFPSLYRKRLKGVT